jgi:hypothetical protein
MLEAKFARLAEPLLGPARTRELISACWALAGSQDVRALAALTRP